MANFREFLEKNTIFDEHSVTHSSGSMLPTIGRQFELYKCSWTSTNRKIVHLKNQDALPERLGQYFLQVHTLISSQPLYQSDLLGSELQRF